MTHPLQTKDDQWRARGNAAEPVFDAGAAPLGTDAEAGGAHAPAPRAQDARPDMAPEPQPQSRGVRLPPMFWIVLAVILAAVLIFAAMASF